MSDPSAANASGTIFFSAPLYRPNLHYKVLSKPSNGRAAIERIGSWIQQNHPCVCSAVSYNADVQW